MRDNGNSLVALNHRRELRGGQTKPQVFECDDGNEWVLKLMGNPIGEAVLAADWIGTVLGHHLGVPVPEPHIAAVTDSALRTCPEGVSAWGRPGPAFGTEYIVESLNLAGTTALFSCANSRLIGRMVVLDTWIETLDRQKPDGTWNMLLDQGQTPPSFLVIDQGLSLAECIRPRGAALIGQADRKFMCPEALVPLIDWIEADAALDAMDNLDDATLVSIVASIPDEWLPEPTVRNETVTYLRNQRPVVRDLVNQARPG